MSTDMFLDDFLNTEYGRKVTKLAKQSCTYSVFYKYWREQLFERIVRLFVWENTYDEVTKEGVPPKQIELRLMLKGHCGICKYKGNLTAFFGSFFGPTVYNNEFTDYMMWSPVWSGHKKIDKNVIVIDNDSMRTPSFNLVHRYAVLLAHNEVTLINALINVRDSGGVPIVSTEKQKASVEQYQNRIFNGQFGVVTDIGSLGISYAGSDRKTTQNLLDIMHTREKLIKSFYSDIGIRSAFEKRNNTIQAEVEADTSLLLFNLSDMLASREDACKRVNNKFGTNWSVHVAKEIDYGAENERVQFDTMTETHNMIVTEEEPTNVEP